MDTRTEGMETRRGARAPKGRQDSSGDDAVIKHQVIADREVELVRLFKAADEAATDLSEALKKAAEDSGYNTATVRKRIASMAHDTFDAEKKKAAQLALIFEVDD